MGAVLLGWSILLAFEHLAVGFGQRELISGSWEMGMARTLVTPIALAALLPLALLAVGFGSLVRRSADEASARGPLAAIVATAAAVVAYGVSFGRHMAEPLVRATFVVGLGLGAFAATWWLLPKAARAFRDGPAAYLLGVPGALVLWLADVRVLPRLYSAFHWGLFVLMLAVAAVVPLASLARRGGDKAARYGGLAVLALATLSVLWAPFAARRLGTADNLRMVLTEHAPIMGRAVRIAALLSPPPPLEPAPDNAAATPGAIPRALDWSARDLLLISVDALRADHLSSYGYARATTPAIDALAAEGALFEAAYCPTPHTSYSVTSMMTGKAMRPLLSLGLGKGSETWAAYVRRYGYRTAAFYPPAVFFIDEDHFTDFEESGFDFEYRKVEFASAEQRVVQVARYLADAPKTPLFLWVHLFEPHEPYVMHESQRFGGAEPTPMDAYDSEIAYADAQIAKLVALVRAERPGVVIAVTADHGEEFGEHGGRYHGTSCYEEQVHVPLVVVGAGIAPRRIATVVQTIDILPTVLSALGVPRPARVRGRDLGPLLVAKDGSGQPADRGVAYAETDEYTLLARASNRLVCARKLGACTLYDVKTDPRETKDVSEAEPAVARELRGLTAAVERDQGRFEPGGAGDAGDAGDWPDAIRRGLQGDVEAAEDIAALLDDASVVVRRKAAEVGFALHSPAVALATRRAMDRDEDVEVQRWCAVALLRMGQPATPMAEALVRDPAREWRRRAALAFAERNDARGEVELATWWKNEAPPQTGLDVERGKELLAALARIRAATAVPALLASFEFVPLRPWIADTLGAIRDARARAPLAAAFAEERYITARTREAHALVALGARSELLAPLARFAGIPEPMTDAIAIAREAKILDAATGGMSVDAPVPTMNGIVSVPRGVPLRLVVLAAVPDGLVSGTAGGIALRESPVTGRVQVIELGSANDARLALHLAAPGGLLAAWVVPHAADIPPPAPMPTDAGPP